MLVRFVGDLSLATTIMLSVIGAVAIWRMYRRETRRGTTGVLSWLLPLLRCTAFVLLLLVLSGPILRHRQTIGELGRVLVFVDNSLSMSLGDPQMPVSQKLLIAQQYGWLPDQSVDETLWLEAKKIRQIRVELLEAMRNMKRTSTPDTVPSLEENTENQKSVMEHTVAAAKKKIGNVGANLARYDSGNFVGLSVNAQTWTQYLEWFQHTLQQTSNSAAKANIGSADPFFEASELCDKIAIAELRLREWFDLSCQKLASSGNPTVAAALTNFDGHSRWSRVESGMLDAQQGLLSRLSSEHDIELMALSGDKAVRMWDSYGAESLPTKFVATPVSSLTDLASAIQSELGNATRGNRDDTKTEPRQTAALIVSDGQHNHGLAPLEMAGQLGQLDIPIFTLGVGAIQEPRDLAILSITHPKSAHRSDRVRGFVTIKDQMPRGTPYVLQIVRDSEIIWQDQILSEDVAERRASFDFPLDNIIENAIADLDFDAKVNSLALQLEAKIVPLDLESNIDNNASPLRIKVAVQQRKVLLIDGRARWEFRYLRNLFERDENWTTNSVIVGPGTENPILPYGDEPGSFPVDGVELRKYDLIVFGEVAPGVLEPQDEIAIREFIEQHAGGIIFIDGNRGHLKKLNDQVMKPLLPVEWMPADEQFLPISMSVTANGRNVDCLMLTPEANENQQLWSFLPVPHAPVLVEALPGSETLVEMAISNGADNRTAESTPTESAEHTTYPLLVTRKFGAGRVLYCATDETWRWRFKNADEYHQRYWNQIANWVMDEPFAVSDEYVSLDADSISYHPGERARLRVRLRDTAGKALSDVSADALLWKDERIVATVHLAADENESGVLRGSTPVLESGEYEVSVQAAGFSNSAMKARIQFSVNDQIEDELKLLGCNAELLNSVAHVSGGDFVGEEHFRDLEALLRPFSNGRVIESETVLWQSFGWFGAIVGVLGLEWLLRKRAGLM